MRPNNRFGLKFAWTETAVVDVKPKSINRPRAAHLAAAISLRQVSFVFAYAFGRCELNQQKGCSDHKYSRYLPARCRSVTKNAYLGYYIKGVDNQRNKHF